MKKNYLYRSLLLTILVVVLVIIAHFIPPIQIGEFTLKKVDFLSDIRKPKEAQISLAESNEIEMTKFSGNIEKDSCDTYVTCIKDFSDDFSSMRRFYSLLDSIYLLNRPVRIAFFGDSFIESDIITADIREQLQAIYGGCGVGYMPLTSVAPGYRKSILHTFQNFTTNSLVKNQSGIGISGYGFRAEENAQVSYQGVNYKKGLSDFSVVRVLYEGSPTIFSSYNINRKRVIPFNLNHQPGIRQALIEHDSIHTVSFSFSPDMLIYGIYLDCNRGIAVDNFAVRGHSGMNLTNVSEEIYRKTNELIPYDLIILQYGLNVSGANTSNYEQYRRRMMENIAHMKSAFPHTDFILMSVGDRDMKSNNDYVTMPGIFNLIPVQEEIAADSQIAFWSTFQAMGGEASMKDFVSSQPPLGAKDYTHLTHEGGKVIATEFVKALLYGKRQFDKQNRR